MTRNDNFAASIRIMRNSLFIIVLSLLFSCSKSGNESSESLGGEAELTKVVFMTDWYPQPEHGGFYQAKVKGFYEEAGLDVEIRSGGGIRDIRPLVALGQTDLAIGTSDTTLIGRSAGLPLVALAPFFIHDPQCVMAHKSLGMNSLEDLDGKVVMMQISLSHAQYLTQVKGLKMKLIPLDFSISRFATDESFAQQCFLTSEPIQLARQGIHPDVIPLSESGFDPYRHIYSSEKFLKSSPEVAKRFIDASIKGWIDYIENDPTPGLEAIAKENPQQKMDFMLEALQAIKTHSLVNGNSEEEKAGVYKEARLREQIEILKEIGMIDEKANFEDSFAKSVLPERFH